MLNATRIGTAGAVCVAALATTALMPSGEAAAQGKTDKRATAIIRSLAPIAGSKGYGGGSGGYGGGSGYKYKGKYGKRPKYYAPPAYRRKYYRPVDIYVGGKRKRYVIDYGRKVDQTVYFPYNSAQLTPRARKQLYWLGVALSSGTLRPYRYLLAGHTDAVGSDIYNRQLSLDRARSVRRYLISRFGIAPFRLLVTGWGESRLKDPTNPYSGINRRVEVALITDYSPGSLGGYGGTGAGGGYGSGYGGTGTGGYGGTGYGGTGTGTGGGYGAGGYKTGAGYGAVGALGSPTLITVPATGSGVSTKVVTAPMSGRVVINVRPGSRITVKVHTPAAAYGAGYGAAGDAATPDCAVASGAGDLDDYSGGISGRCKSKLAKGDVIVNFQ